MTREYQLRQSAADATHRQTGNATSSLGVLSYTAAREREIQEKPSFTRHRTALQGADGAFVLRPKDDGSLETGHFGIDAFGRFVTV